MSKSWNNDNQPNRGIFYTLSQSYAFSLKKAKTFRIYSARYPQQNHMEANPHGRTIFENDNGDFMTGGKINSLSMEHNVEKVLEDIKQFFIFVSV